MKHTLFLYALVFGMFFPETGLAQDSADAALRIDQLAQTVAANHAAHQETLNHIWTMVAATLVLFMQGGFLLLEAGMVRSKNSINVAQKNIIDFLIAVAVFYAFGFALMFGPSVGGFIGWSSDLALFSQTEDWNYTFFVFQAVFAGTAGTIVSGAVAERTKLSGYIWITILIAVLIYPVVGHWGWGNLLVAENETYLTRNGFIDFAGSTIVHSVGGWVALAACIVVGPRIGRFDPQTGKPKRLHGHSLVLSTLGCLILWMGWIGFNGGSTTVGSPDFAHIIFNTVIAATFGGLVALSVGRWHEGYFSPNQSINGVLGGLVAITAGCDAVDAWGAMAIGACAGALVHYGCYFLSHVLKIDDVVDAIPVHGFCGAFGTIALAFFATEEKLGGTSVWAQASIQVQGVLIAFAWAFGVTYVACKILDKMFGLRVSEQYELDGLNVSEHNASLGTGLLQQRLKDVVDGTRDLTQRIDIEHGDESAEVAAYINQFIGQMQELMHGIHDEAGRLEHHSVKMSEISAILAASSNEMTTKSGEVTQVNKLMTEEANRIAQLVDDMGDQIHEVAGSANHMTQNMEFVSEAIYNLTQSIDEVAHKSDMASDVAGEANDLTHKASETVGNLADAAKAIGDVVELIKAIASQTNLLALNATIEASRAGDAGKGFAVVAHEVKTLASQTAKATEEIENRIANIQSSSGNVADIIADVSDIIEKINSSVANISTITRDQNMAASTISDSIAKTVAGTQQVTQTIDAISDNAHGIATGARQAAENAQSVHESIATFADEIASSSANAHKTHAASHDIKRTSKNLSGSIGAYKIYHRQEDGASLRDDAAE
jgi:Amt family ammonium transporter